MSNRIRQINITFLAEEDRLLLRLNTTDKDEFRIWLTRRVVRQFALGLSGAERRLLGLENQPAPGTRAIQEFQREARTAGVDFNERFTEGAGNFPFGAEPVLATGFEVRPQGESVIISIAGGNKGSLSFVLGVRDIHGILAMLQKAVAQSDWDLGQVLENPPLPPPRPSAMH